MYKIVLLHDLFYEMRIIFASKNKVVHEVEVCKIDDYDVVQKHIIELITEILGKPSIEYIKMLRDEELLDEHSYVLSFRWIARDDNIATMLKNVLSVIDKLQYKRYRVPLHDILKKLLAQAILDLRRRNAIDVLERLLDTLSFWEIFLEEEDKQPSLNQISREEVMLAVMDLIRDVIYNKLYRFAIDDIIKVARVIDKYVWRKDALFIHEPRVILVKLKYYLVTNIPPRGLVIISESGEIRYYRNVERKDVYDAIRSMLSCFSDKNKDKLFKRLGVVKMLIKTIRERIEMGSIPKDIGEKILSYIISETAIRNL